jgi:exonuclease III
MDEGNSRIHVIQIDTNASPICLINVYMPSNNKEMDCEYTDMISQLSEVIEKYRNTHEIVICGDMNGSAHQDKTSHDPLFKKFLLENRIGLSIHYPEKDTFYHHNGKSSGQIDYIISTCKNILKKVEIMDMDPKNTSDHVPVIAQIKRKLVRRAYKPKTTIVKTQ